jgi:radical SAM-linked protein
VYASAKPRENEQNCEKGIAGELRERLAIRYAVDGDLRFISHQDSLRLFRRALARAGIPVRHSEGCNPRPRLRIALPRPVGVASLDELLIVEMDSVENPSDVLTRLSAQVPQGMRLVSAERPADRDRCLPCEVQCELAIDPAQRDAIADAVSRFLSRDTVVVQRTTPGDAAVRSVDIRRYVRDMTVCGDFVTWTQAVSQSGTARMAEILDAIDLSAGDHLHRVVRRRVSYEP